MANPNQMAEMAALIGDPARAAILSCLMDGRALTATELARVAGVMPQTASGHLSRLTAARLLVVEKQGRHKYHRLASSEVARMLESIMQLAVGNLPVRAGAVRVGPRDVAMRRARTCYDHLAGQLGVAIADAMVESGFIEFSDDAGALTGPGQNFFGQLGLDAALQSPDDRRTTRVFCRRCLDWSERRWHVGGHVGAVLCTHAFDKGWVRRIDGTRALDITPFGQRALRDTFGVVLAVQPRPNSTVASCPSPTPGHARQDRAIRR